MGGGDKAQQLGGLDFVTSPSQTVLFLTSLPSDLILFKVSDLSPHMSQPVSHKGIFIGVFTVALSATCCLNRLLLGKCFHVAKDTVWT